MVTGKYFLVFVAISIYTGYSISNPVYTQEQIKDKKNIVPVLVLGSGPAGLTAGMYTSRSGVYTILFQGNKPGGQLMDASIVENWPGMSRMTGAQAMQKMENQTRQFGAHIVPGTIDKIDFSQWPFKAVTQDNIELNALSVIIATGAKPRKLGVPGEDTYWGKGVLGCAICDAPLSKNQDVVVVGGDSAALERIFELLPYAKTITVIVRKPKTPLDWWVYSELKKTKKVTVLFDQQVEKILGDGKHVTGIIIRNMQTGKQYTKKTRWVFLSVGFEPDTQLFKNQLELTKDNCIALKNNSQEASVSGVFAAGNAADCTYRQAGVAAGDGSKAALDALKFLNKLGIAYITQLNSKQFYTPKVKVDYSDVRQINSPQELNRLIKRQKTPFVVEFFSPGCPHCMAMKPIVAATAHYFRNALPLYTVDINRMRQLSEKFAISGVPTFLFFNNSQLVDSMSGEMTKKELIDFIGKKLRQQQ